MRFSLDRRFMLLAFICGAPAVTVALAFVWIGTLRAPVKWALAAGIVLAWAASTRALRAHLVHQLRTISNMLAALREDDFTIRARGARPDEPFGAVLHELNLLADTLRMQRLGAQEATALLRAVMAEIDVAIFAFDGAERLVLVNRYGERLLGRPMESLLGQSAAALGFLSAPHPHTRVQTINFPGGSGQWEIRRRVFWQGGHPHELVVLTDVSQPLREQEREAWQRLIRVIGHELNNSLAPIKSIAGSLATLLGKPSLPDDWREDAARGLTIIMSRADGLSRFMSAYAQLARLPAPQLHPTMLAGILRRVSVLDGRVPVTLHEDTDVLVSADVAQLEQLLINVFRNAVEATLETGGAVTAGWTTRDDIVEVWVDDEGPGIRNTSNLFVPFFTTKPSGSGIGLVLSRQIAEGHGGSFTLQNRRDRQGTRAALRIPVLPAAHTPARTG
jgi:two-component system nitrogen regulation sensor histidine kinase NtrY